MFLAGSSGASAGITSSLQSAEQSEDMTVMIGIGRVRYEIGDYLPSERSPIGKLIIISSFGHDAWAWIRTEDGSFVEVRPRNMRAATRGDEP